MVWNCQGAGKRKFVRNCNEFCRINKPEVLAIVEPRISGRRATQVVRRLRFSSSHRVEARGFAGGIWLLWDETRIQMSILFNHPQFIHAKVTRGDVSFLFTAVYGCPQEKWRKFLWLNLEALALTINEPWIVAGDFNAILAGEERRNKYGQAGQTNAMFADCMLKTNLLDLGFVGGKYTWRSGSRRARLDRFICNDEWRIKFPEASVIHLPRIGSDHCPVLLKSGTTPPPPDRRPFRYLAAWQTHPGFGQFVMENWVSSTSFHDTIQHFMDKLKMWNRETFGNIHLRKKRLLARISGIQRFLEHKNSAFLTDLETELRLELDGVLLQEELLWLQKSRRQWVQDGDRNTTYFHMSTIIRRKQNKIEALIDDNGVWQTDPDSLQHLATNYFRQLFCDDGPVPHIFPLPNHFVQKISSCCSNGHTVLVPIFGEPCVLSGHLFTHSLDGMSWMGNQQIFGQDCGWILKATYWSNPLHLCRQMLLNEVLLIWYWRMACGTWR
ncbi:hypothetical protein Tsubulata_004319 [Turnera subulata]|uniref:Endonuclease/exonuclease/phosphatase domain-containing protein n=1 Tax=Turnera subulata TaxID=218843 RepID=A0A9Q0FKP1_9ROSI|nr:hypothetical protein Tsubulata_004319 [Turnera subulata]